MEFSYLKFFTNIHLQGNKPNTFVFSTPRSGSTWLMEILTSQPGVKYINEPFNLRDDKIKRLLRGSNWSDLYNPGSEEIIEKYLNILLSSKFKGSFKNQSPFTPGYNFYTNRIVLKILHCGEDKIDWFKNTFQGQVVYLVRHPIPTSLSRKQLPRLKAFISSDYSKNFQNNQLALAKSILKKGNKLEMNILDWCFQNAIPLKNLNSDWLLITYEQLVLEPEKTLSFLLEKLKLKYTKAIQKSMSKASGSSVQSDEETQKALQDHKNNKFFLVEKWKDKILPEEENRIMNIVKAFGIDIYEEGNVLPNKKYLI